MISPVAAGRDGQIIGFHGQREEVAPASRAASIAPSATVIVANASRQRPAWASLRSWAKPSVTFGFWARGTWLFGRLCFVEGGLAGGFGGRRWGGVRAMAVMLSRRRDAGDMFPRSAARRRRGRAALPPELAGALRGVVCATARVPAFAATCMHWWAKMHYTGARHGCWRRRLLHRAACES